MPKRRLDRLPNLVTELVHSKVDVIVAVSTPAIEAAKQATHIIPIIMAGVSDPVGTGFVASLARPGGNITGFSLQSPQMTENGWSYSRKLFLSSPVSPFWSIGRIRATRCS